MRTCNVDVDRSRTNALSLKRALALPSPSCPYKVEVTYARPGTYRGLNKQTGAFRCLFSPLHKKDPFRRTAAWDSRCCLLHQVTQADGRGMSDPAKK